MKKILCCFLLLAVLALRVHAQEPISVYPTNWWVGMKMNRIQIMLHDNQPNHFITGDNLLVQSSSPALKIIKVNKLQNRRYLILDALIAPGASAQTVTLTLSGVAGTTNSQVRFPLLPRRKGNGTAYAQGVRSADFIYFLMPDRFSNGDESNDRLPGLRDQSLNRDSIFLRHGGDLQGVINHLDYLQQLGVTALWMTPVIENNMPDRTEHGYAFTNHYAIEPRFGGEVAYLALSDSLHRRGMKLVQDAVYNHIGSFHFLVLDPPDSNWLHQWPVPTQPNYKEQVFFDPHASAYDKKKMADGWFTNMMPDVNQGNPYTANFLIQHAIWCVEKFGVDAWRIDTYKYCDLNFMNRCNQALLNEYPNITFFGENWNESVANQAYFTKNIFNTAFKSNLTGAIDFEFLFRGIQPALTQAPNGVSQLYQTVSQDFMYQQPMNNVVFLDNHDMTRFFSAVGEDVAKQKMGLSWLFTTRGIPQLYYGTEIMMKGVANPDGWVRLDFPGGWKGDQKNAFTGAGLSAEERAVQDLTLRLAAFRAGSSALKTGALMQFIPENGVYVYFRYDNQQTVMCIMNTNDGQATIDLTRFAERVKNYTKAMDVATGTVFPIENNAITLGGKYLLVLELR
ncbi:MAG TPA: alpha-amylase family glycosyl hydrolase [Chitinophagaceae bacterium]|nr:alpha-amylase family glycosyl hydrolase [Chitinophagaceae bacterium]